MGHFCRTFLGLRRMILDHSLRLVFTLWVDGFGTAGRPIRWLSRRCFASWLISLMGGTDGEGPWVSVWVSCRGG